MCESAPKWDPFSSPGKHLISERKLDRGGVRIGADRDPAGGGLSRLDQRLMLKSAGGPTSVLIHTTEVASEFVTE